MYLKKTFGTNNNKQNKKQVTVIITHQWIIIMGK